MPRRDRSRAGFTLLEALVALALLLAFATVVGPQLYQARRIMDGAEGRASAQMLMRSLLAAPFDRASLQSGPREGDSGGMHWRLSAEPMFISAMHPPPKPRYFVAAAASGAEKPADKPKDWSAYRVVASVSWGAGRQITAETVRLGGIASDE